jgi:hypothetical protein
LLGAAKHCSSSSCSSTSTSRGMRNSTSPQQAQPPPGTGPAPDEVPAALTSVAPPAKLQVRLQLVVCHAAVNMERTVLPGTSSVDSTILHSSPVSRAGRAGRWKNSSSSSSSQLQTMGLLSLLLLDADAAVQPGLEAPQAVAGDPAADALVPAVGSGMAAAQALGMTCSVAHMGLQDLCACVEQRHALSGSSEPFQVCRSSTDPPHSCTKTHRHSQGCSLTMMAG